MVRGALRGGQGGEMPCGIDDRAEAFLAIFNKIVVGDNFFLPGRNRHRRGKTGKEEGTLAEERPGRQTLCETVAES